MAIWNDFPYTNFHEQNQDWMLRLIKQLADDFAKVNGGFEAIEKEFESFKDYVESQIHGLDFYPSVSQKIDEMISDGSFANLLLDSNVKFPLEFRRIFRLHVKDGRYTENPTGIIAFQGIAIDGAGNFYFTAVKTSVESETGDELGYIYKTDGYGNILNIVTDAKIGHGNSLAFSVKDNKLMCANLHGKLTVFDSNLKLLNTFTIPTATFSVNYDYASEKPLVIAGRKIYEINLTSGSLKELNSFVIGSEWATRQNYSVQGNYIYSIDSQPNSLAKFDRKTGRTIYIQNFYDCIDIWKVGELESVCYDVNGNMYLMSFVHVSDKFIVNVFKSNRNFSAQGSPIYAKNNFYNRVVVDPTLDVHSPDGTPSKPFASIEDALCLLNNVTRVLFAKKCQCLDEYIIVDDNPSFSIEANGSVFGGIQWTNSAGGLYNVEINNSDIANPIYTAPVNFYRSKITVENIKVTSTKPVAALVRVNDCLASFIKTDFANFFTGEVTNHIFSFGGGFISSSESFCRGVFRDSEGSNTSPARFTGTLADGTVEVGEAQLAFIASQWGFCNFLCRLNDGKAITLMRNMANRYEIISTDGIVKIVIDKDFKHFSVSGLGGKQIKQIYAT